MCARKSQVLAEVAKNFPSFMNIHQEGDLMFCLHLVLVKNVVNKHLRNVPSCSVDTSLFCYILWMTNFSTALKCLTYDSLNLHMVSLQLHGVCISLKVVHLRVGGWKNAVTFPVTSVGDELPH